MILSELLSRPAYATWDCTVLSSRAEFVTFLTGALVPALALGVKGTGCVVAILLQSQHSLQGA
jgi:hypothetical protein